jgi:hypothetical protein
VETFISALALVVTIAALWTGRKRLEASRFTKSVLSALELILLGLSLVLLGWLGFALFLVANVVGFAGWGIYLAMAEEEKVIYAATQAGVEKEEIQALHRRIRRSHKAFRIMGRIEVAELISLLAQRARNPSEIEEMALPVALLWVVHRPDLAYLVERFDTVLRLHGEPASESMRVADTLTAATKASAATFTEMLDAMVVASGGTPGSKQAA